MEAPDPSTIAIPGQDLGPATRYRPGPGTHLHDRQIHASIPGTITITAPKPTGPPKRLTKITPAGPPPPLPIISVRRGPAELGKGQGQGQEGSSSAARVLPEVQREVLGRVTRVTTRQATVAILVVGGVVLAGDGEWQGLIRVQDVRATEKDRVKISESFRPGDVVRAVVISLGDQANYYLSTASNHLGVIMATSEAGNAMYPVSWKEYRDPETGLSESRKVAKPF